MVSLDIHIDDKLLERINRLAIEHYGGNSEASRGRVVETALQMRMLWSKSVDKGQQETDEAVSKWEYSESPVTEENAGTISNWLFRR